MSNICQAPFTGFVIGPIGDIKYCCMSSSGKQKTSIGNIEDIEDLEEFFRTSKDLNFIRNEFLNDRYSSIEYCSSCYKSEQCGYSTFKNIIGDKYPHPVQPDYIRYLEFTTSNICNAACSMCSSAYSSSWMKYEKSVGREIFPIAKLSEKSIEKIVKVLPKLDWLSIKGGEPFADKNNFYILNKLFDTNTNCNVSINSNMSILDQKHLETIKRNPKKVFLFASIDGIGKVYNWIRSTDFNVVTSNMEKLYYETGIQSEITITLDVYNYFNLIELIDYFLPKPYVNKIAYRNVILTPKYSILSLPEDLFNEQRNKIIKYHEHKKNEFNYSNKFDMTSFEHFVMLKNPIENKELVFDLIDKMNAVRGFDLCDHVPELKKWRDG